MPCDFKRESCIHTFMVNPNTVVNCITRPCEGVNKSRYIIPNIEVDPEKIRMMMISEVTPTKPEDYYYAQGEPLFVQTTIQAFQDAGLDVHSINELVEMGIYFTTAVKCGKTSYTIKADPIKQCSQLLEQELDMFPNLKVIMLMGDVAIKAFNYIARRKIGKRVIPSGSTYKIRKGEYYYNDIRVFPSYLQAGPSFFIERSKRRMIKEDLKQAHAIIGD